MPHTVTQSKPEGRRNAQLRSMLAPARPIRSGLRRKLEKHTLPRWRPKWRGETSTCPSDMARSTRCSRRRLTSMTTSTWRTLRTVAEHPPFDRTDLETPVPSPGPIPDPPEPIFTPPVPPQGLKGLFGGKSHEKAVAEAAAAHEVAVAQWQSAVVEAESARKARVRWHADQEAKRVAALEVERARYAEECAEREAAVAERNKALDTLDCGSRLRRGSRRSRVRVDCALQLGVPGSIFRSSTILSLTPPLPSCG